jgi:4-amino-4-deoxy-L-arabinose transferase-like glycosyltransferase
MPSKGERAFDHLRLLASISTMISLLIWAAILWACFGAGAALLQRLRAQADTSGEEIPFAIALGMGLLAYLLLLLGLLGQVKLWVGLALICLLALLGWRQMLRLVGDAITAGQRPKPWPWAALPLLIFFLAAIAFTLIGALAPATESDYDSLVYHLALPKAYLRDHRIHLIPWLSHSNFPFTMEMLYLLGLMLRDQSLAKLFHCGCGWLTVCAIFAFGRRCWGPRAGALGAAIFAAIPLVAWEMMSAYNELAFALYAFLAIFALSRWFQGREAAGGQGWLWVAGLMCGLALGTKMLAGAVLAFGLLALLWALLRLPQRRAMVVPIIGFAAIATAVASPWYLKSYLWTGNPVYPFFYGLFDGRYWTAERAREYTQAQREFGQYRPQPAPLAQPGLMAAVQRAFRPGSGPLAFLALPWNLTMHPRWYFDVPQHLRPVNILVWAFGPLLLALLPALLFAGPIGPPGRSLLWFALLYVLLWFTMSQNGRYLIPILPGLCACAGLAASRLLERRGLLSAAATLALLLAFASGLYASYGLASPAMSVALGTESPQQYLTEISPLYRALDQINRATPANARILALGDEPRLFYLERDYLLGNHAQIFSQQDVASADSFLAALKHMRVTHLLLSLSAMRDMARRRGAVEADLAQLQAQGKIRLVGFYGTLSLTLGLWQIADPGS